MNVVRYADRPDLLEIRFETLTRPTFPEYLNNNVPGNLYWGRLYEDFPDFQLALLDGDDLVAELHSVPTAWDGSDDDLPSGWDEAFLRAFEGGREADVLCALAISVRPDRQGERLSSRMLEEMRRAGGSHGLRDLIAPVRPTRKQLYPLIPIERYAEWRREDGSHFDPWIRVHERVGGVVIAPLSGVDDDRGAGVRLGGVDGHGVPRRRRLRLPGRPRAAPRAQRDRSPRRAQRVASALALGGEPHDAVARRHEPVALE